MMEEFPMLSCWDCNPSHKHLKNALYAFWCAWCGKIYFEGKELTGEL